MAYWLLKSEPDSYSFEDLRRDKVTGWSNIRNFKARSYLKSMQVGDEAFFYHTGERAAIMGTATIVKEAYPDPTQFEPGDYFEPKATKEKPYWYQVDVKFGRAFANPVDRPTLKSQKSLANMAVLQYNRLSVTPVEPNEWNTILKLGETPNR